MNIFKQEIGLEYIVVCLFKGVVLFVTSGEIKVKLNIKQKLIILQKFSRQKTK